MRQVFCIFLIFSLDCGSIFRMSTVSSFCLVFFMDTHTGEQEVTIWSLFVLILTLVVVYSMFFGVQKNNATASLLEPGKSDTTTQVVLQPTPASAQIVPLPATTPSPLVSLPPTPSHIFSVQQLFGTAAGTPPAWKITPTPAPVAPTEKSAESITSPETDDGIMHLAGTHHWQGKLMKSATLLELNDSIKYILKNNDNTHFVYLGHLAPDITDRIRTLWWKTVAITNKNDIYTHWLFWNTVVFITVPAYTGIKKLLLVHFKKEDDRWFLQVDEDIFERTKPLLAELFSARYDRSS